MQERRQYIRVKSPVLVEFPHPQTMKTQRTFTYDVSETGLRFPSMVAFQLGQDVALTLHLPLNNTTFHTTGEVIWIRELARQGAAQYDVGVRFHWIEDPDRQQLTHQLQSLLRGKM